MDKEIVELCAICRSMASIVFTDDYGRDYCGQCLNEMPPTIWIALQYLMLTIPFKVGDKVRAKTAGVIYDGIGTIDEISIDPETFGTPVYPSFHVVFDDKAYPEVPDSVWYCERQLERVS